MAPRESPPLTVAVIGAGPGGMFFCHALERHRLELVARNDLAALAALPSATCFERASGPGGVWRTAAVSTFSGVDEGDAADVAMYDALWTNGPKEAIEFFDYTFEEHFGAGTPLPTYMPRRDVLDYVLGRVTARCPAFFEKYVRFDATVRSVRFLEDPRQFEVVVRRGDGTVGTERYDRCVWAAGMNGRPAIPPALRDVFRDFAGTVRHSSDAKRFDEDVRGKRVLLVGGSYSAEDLALAAIKCDAARIFVSARRANVVTWTAAWPYGKVEVLQDVVPVRVTEGGRCIGFADTEEREEREDRGEDPPVQTELRDIDTVLFCTGYAPGLDMLSEELRRAATVCAPPEELPVPPGWKMPPNALSEGLGEIEPDGETRVAGPLHPGLYRGAISIQNPHMMFMKFEFENPLFGIDVNAHLLVRYIVGSEIIPSAEEMVEREQDAALSLSMDNPWTRCMVDGNYFAAVDENWQKLFPDIPEEEKYEAMDLFQSDYEQSLEIRVLAQRMQEADYPLSFGSFQDLNETAAAYRKFDALTHNHRARLTDADMDNGRTFRDYRTGDEEDKLRSVFTGALAVPLEKRWLDVDANYSTIIEP